MNSIFGIDISTYNKGIDLKRARDEGVNFTIICLEKRIFIWQK